MCLRTNECDDPWDAVQPEQRPLAGVRASEADPEAEKEAVMLRRVVGYAELPCQGTTRLVGQTVVREPLY